MTIMPLEQRGITDSRICVRMYGAWRGVES
jgi:hypothetical protein